MDQRYSLSLFATALWVAGCLPVIYAADVGVQVGPGTSYTPRDVTINVNDRVVWTWANSTHTTTHSGSPPLWDSGFRSTGTFDRVFTAVGTFNYYCAVVHHAGYGQRGSVTVQAPNTPPTVSITNPVNNAVLIAPATFTITATAADPGGTVSQVEFFRDTTSLGFVTTSPYSTNVNNLAAGTYAISAVATDNLAAKATNSITVSVVTPVAITVSAPQYLSATQFQFRYTANPGLRYVVKRSPIFTNWTSVTTNTASSTSELFQDDITNGRNFYRVELLPNP